MDKFKLIPVIDSHGKRIKNLFTRNGNFYLQKQINGKRYTRRIHAASLKQARAFVLDFTPHSTITVHNETKPPMEFGIVFKEYITNVKHRGHPILQTAHNNVQCLRRILAASFPDRSVDELPVDTLTGKLARSYATISMKGITDPALLETKRRSIRSQLRQARSIFKTDMLPIYREHGEIEPEDFCTGYVCDDPDITRLPFTKEELATMRSGIHLKNTDPNMYLAWLLGSQIALRASEMAACRWSWIVKGEHGYFMEIIKRLDEDFKPKGIHGNVPMHDTLVKELLKYRNSSDFILPGITFDERYDLVTRKFTAWMRAQGWTRRHCIHELRAYRAQEWREAYGINVAADWARHSNIRTLLVHYTVNHNNSQPAMPLAV